MTKAKKTSPSKCKAKPSTRRSTPTLKQTSDNTFSAADDVVSVATTLAEIILQKLKTAKASGLQGPTITPLPLAWGRTEPALLAAGPGVEPWWQRSVRKPNKSVQDLASLLIHHGGTRACIPFEEVPLSHAYSALGTLVIPKKVKMKRGEPNRCHSNSIKEWTKSMGKLSLVTGFGLTADDGLWCAHSWLTTDKGQIIETTVPRDMYFGVQFNEEDLLQLCKAVMEARGWEVIAA